MEHLTVLILSLVLCLSLCDAAPTIITPDDRQLAEENLTQFYKDPDATQLRAQSMYHTYSKKVLKNMQEFFGLEVTDKMDTNTLEVMKQLRCGVTDLARSGNYGMSRWKQSILTYRITNYTAKLSRSEVDSTIAKAFQLYSDVIPLDFKQIYSGTADIMILFQAKEHGDKKPFDGPGKVFAHAYYPQWGGDAHFDEDESWSLTAKGVNLFLVAAHEFGHALGLSHSDNRPALMFPNYQYVDTNGYRLPQEDRLRIQNLYGVRTSTDKPAPKPQPKPNPGSNYPKACKHNLVLDAATKIQGKLYFFKNGYYWKKGYNSTVSWHKINTLWPSVHSVDAAYEFKKRDITFLFEGQWYWAVRGSKILPGYPKHITKFGFPSSVKEIDAAVHVASTGRTLFFVGNKYWSFNEMTAQMDHDFPKRIQHNIPKIGSHVNAAFENAGYLYFSYGAWQIKYDFSLKQVNVLRNKAWLNCYTKKA